MSKAVNSKWKKTFPDTIGNQNRPANGVDDTQPFETGGFPQYIANDPVRYDLQNAAMSQSMSNDARLKEMIDARGKELDDHKVDPGAHKTGIAGNAATATKVVTTAATGASANIAEASMGGSDSARIRVSGAENAGELALETANDGDEAIVARQYTGVYTNAVRTAKILDESGNTSFPGTVVAPKFTGTLNGNASTATKLATPRTLSLSGKAAGSTTFDGTANASINVTLVNADTASKLSTARKINITGNATGSTSFDGTNDVSINVTVNSATKATNDSNGANIASTYVKKAGDTTTGKITFASTDLNALPEVKKTSDDNISGVRFSSKTKFLGAVGKRLSNGEDLLNLRSDNNTTDVVLDSRNYNNYAPTKTGTGASGTWGINISGNAVNDGNGANIANTYLKKATVIDVIYPVGSIYMSMSATNPADLFGVGTWKRISQGRMLLGADDSTYKAGATGGEATHTLTAAEMPAHSHTGTTSTNGNHTHQVSRNIDLSNADPNGEGGSHDTICDYDGGTNFKTSTSGNHNHTFTTDNTGDGTAHNNMPPYLVCYIWQRTA